MDIIENTEKVGQSENVCVFIRIRPLNSKETEQHCGNVMTVDPYQNAIILNKPNSPKPDEKTFQFDHIFAEECTQTDLYERAASSIVQQIFHGYNGTIFAYGQTGSGKTYTMSGNQDSDDLKGVIPNTFAHIFSQIAEASDIKKFVVTATYLEIYNEEVRDLLSKNPNQKLPVRERKDIGVYVQGLTGYTVDSIESINRLMKLGSVNRKTRATAMNDVSSRSHAIFAITIEAKNRKDNTTTVAKLNLVDLAGSERLSRSHASGDGLRETSNINQSLFVLSNVISALVEAKTGHIPYRNSKLTRLLQNSLGGNSKTAMIATVSPCSLDYDETLCTLRYASRAKLIKNYVKLNLQTDNSLIARLEQQLLDLQKQLSMLTLNEEKMVKQKKKERLKCDKAMKHKEQDEELKRIEATKQELIDKINGLKAKLLVGNKQEDEEPAIELEEKEGEVEKAQEETLKKAPTPNIKLSMEYTSLLEEDAILDEKIAEAEALIENTKAQYDEQVQRQTSEIDLLRKSYYSTAEEIKRITALLQNYIPDNQLQKIFSNIHWNSNTCDFQIRGIAYTGNNIDTTLKRRLRIMQTVTVGVLLPKRRTRKQFRFIKPTTKNVYKSYSEILSRTQLDEDRDDTF